MKSISRPFLRAVVLVFLALSGCVIYQPAAKDPRSLATIECVPFPIRLSPAHLVYLSKPPVAKPWVAAVDGAVRIVNTLDVRPFQTDAGLRKLKISCDVNINNGNSSFPAVKYSSATFVELEVESAKHYLVQGRMTGVDISYGAEIWIEEKATGNIVLPPQFVDMIPTATSPE